MAVVDPLENRDLSRAPLGYLVGELLKIKDGHLLLSEIR